MAHDVFISYSSRDKQAADAACAKLESRGLRCWIAPRDVAPGKSYAECLIDAIGEARVFVLVFSENANRSDQVLREVERAVSKGIPILPFRIEDVVPTKSMEYFLSTPHWLDAMTPPLKRHLDKLCDSVAALLHADAAEPVAHSANGPAQTPPANGTPVADQPRKVLMGALAVCAVICVVILAAMTSGIFTKQTEPDLTNAPTTITDKSDNNTDEDKKDDDTVDPPPPRPLELKDQDFKVAEGAEAQHLNAIASEDLPDNLNIESLRVTILTKPAHGAITTYNRGTFVYTHSGGDQPTDEFTYKVEAPDGRSDRAIVKLTITPDNDAPEAKDDSYAVKHASAINIAASEGLLANDTDADSKRLEAEVAKEPSHGTLRLNPNGSFSYTHDGSNVPQDLFEYRVTDGEAWSDTGRVTIAIGEPKVPLKFPLFKIPAPFGFGETPAGWRDISDPNQPAEHFIEIRFDNKKDDGVREFVFGGFVLVIEADVAQQQAGFAATLLDDDNASMLVVQAVLSNRFAGGNGWNLSAGGKTIDINYPMPPGPRAFRLERTDGPYIFSTDAKRGNAKGLPYQFKSPNCRNFDALRLKLTRGVTIRSIQLIQKK